jgi:intraflagellar transport protein 140
VYVVNGRELQVRTTSGEVKSSLDVETNSAISHISLTGKYLCLGSHGALSLQLFLYDVSRRVPKLLSTSVFSIKNRIYRIRSIAVSRGGFCVSVAIDFFRSGKWENAPRIYLHSPQKQKTASIDPDSGNPLQHCWDSVSASVLCIQTAAAVHPFFVDTSLETIALRSLPLGSERTIFRVEVPRVWHVTDATRTSPLSVDTSVSSSLLAQFIALDGVDPSVRRILIEVMLAVKSEKQGYAVEILNGITEEPVLRAAFKFCLAIQARDLVNLCASKLPEEDSHSEGPAAGFFERGKPGSFEEVGQIAVPTDKLNVRANQFLLGLRAESVNDFDGATTFFDKAEMKTTELLRMAMHQGSLSHVFKIAGGGFSDPQFHFWMGRFYEVHEQFDIALSHYDLSGDLRESIRLLCLLGRYDEANRRVSETDQKTAVAAYARLLTKRYQTLRDEQLRQQTSKRIIDLFQRIGQHGPAFEFAFDHALVDALPVLALRAPRILVSKAATHFESTDNVRLAAILWYRAGRMNRALTLCLERDSYDTLEELADSVEAGTDPEVLTRCADVFIDNGQIQRATVFLALGLQFDRARQLCEERRIKLPHSIIESAASLATDPESMAQIAALCEQQEAFFPAAQLYIALGDHLAAMRSIIAAGDTEKVIRFASLLKRKDAFLWAADYIAGTHPRESEPLFPTCIQLYQQAGAFDKLTEFLLSTAQAEIDDEQNYEKAVLLLRRAHQTMARSDLTKERDRLVEVVLQKIRWVEMYLEAARCAQTDPSRMQSICNQLLQTKGIEKCLRVEDVYMLLVQYALSRENFAQAHRMLENMRTNGVELKDVMEEETIQRIYRAAGQVYVPPDQVQPSEEVEIPDDVVEVVSDDF